MGDTLNWTLDWQVHTAVKSGITSDKISLGVIQLNRCIQNSIHGERREISALSLECLCQNWFSTVAEDGAEDSTLSCIWGTWQFIVPAEDMHYHSRGRRAEQIGQLPQPGIYTKDLNECRF